MNKNTFPRKATCNRIDPVPFVNRFEHQQPFCGNCGRDLEKTTGANGFRHTATFVSRDTFEKGN